MIVLSGTKRSGTSLWMQILSEAGLHLIGDRFPRNWEEKLKQANPNGFYESILRTGIYFETNPHPHSGRYLRPEVTKRLLVKVFPSGVARSDVAFLDHMVLTVRPWRDVVRSLRVMRALEAKVFRWGEAERQPLFLPPEVEWLRENFLVVRDMRLRQYPQYVCPHSYLMSEPEAAISSVLDFFGGPVERAAELAKLVDRRLERSSAAGEVSTVFDPELCSLVDTWMDHVESGEWGHQHGIKALEGAWKRAHARDLMGTALRWDDPRVCGGT